MRKTALLIGTLLVPGMLASGANAKAPEGKALSEPDPKVLALAMKAVDCAEKKGIAPQQQRLTIIDYSKPSSVPRLWVLDLKTHQWLFHELVAHGKNTGVNDASKFSNKPNSLQSSIGLFLTGDVYKGKHGMSMRLKGLEKGFNDRAYERAVVMHGANYVSEAMIQQCGRLGRSWGCPAVRPEVTKSLIDTLKGGSFVFSYYPDPNWLQNSTMLQGCQADGKDVGGAQVLTVGIKGQVPPQVLAASARLAPGPKARLAGGTSRRASGNRLRAV